ncbi:zinc finger and BTB domain-containing protein 21 [Engraulis encrasicolus]|uniref:zinc finger and BTB domain-containing protein 21 n=1 Tax=Engraulis encrasicolus TaxID=184585 RepID=UPI002FCF300C
MENLVHYSNPAHAISLLSVLNEQRLRGQLCDVVLAVGEQRYQAHRSVLAASSEYFHTLFTPRGAATSTSSSSSSSPPVVTLDFCEPDAFELVLNYIYSSSLFVDKGSLAAIQELGYSLGIPFLTNIMSMRPQMSYCISRSKRVCFKEEDDGGSHPQRSVIVRQSRGHEHLSGSGGDRDRGAPSHSSHSLRPSKHNSSSSNPYSAPDQDQLAAFGLSAKEQNQTSRSSSSRGNAIERGGDVTTSDRRPGGGSRLFDVQQQPHDDKPNSALALSSSSALRGRGGLSSSTCVRPQLTSSVSFSESQIQHASLLQQDSSVELAGDGDEHHRLSSAPHSLSPSRPAGPGAPGQLAERHQAAVDRSGPLIKSLLRRSLSMDSPVPIFSPALELKDAHNREHSVVKMAAKMAGGGPLTGAAGEQRLHSAAHGVPPLILRPRHHNLYDRGGGAGGRGDGQGPPTEVHVKTEPSSPLADPSDIIRITVGDNLPVNLRDLQMNFSENPKGYFNHHAGKRRSRLDGLGGHGGGGPYKRSRMSLNFPLGINKVTLFYSTLLYKDTGSSAVAAHNNNNTQPQQQQANSNMAAAGGGGGDGSEEPGELRPNKMFKCWNCLKIFRSNAGLYRHVNMYHNPEKPYACDICHKRFHTNFKVWTHCQTQHGVVQNPAASSSSYSVLDEKFQRKLIDIVREREIKKALLLKLRRNKQSLQQAASQQPFGRKSLRSRSTYVCPYCGKMFWFQSQFKQHLKMHPVENEHDEDEDGDAGDRHMDQRGGGGGGGGGGPDGERQDLEAHLKENQGQEQVYPCKLCNAKLSSPMEQGDHERGCRHATVCPYCGLRFSSPSVKRDHEAHCDYKKLTCLECMRTFKSSFSIWRHQVEVHNHNMMTVREQLSLSLQENHSQASPSLPSGGGGGATPDSLHGPGTHPAMPPLHHQHQHHHQHSGSMSDSPLDARKDGTGGGGGGGGGGGVFYRDSSSPSSPPPPPLPPPHHHHHRHLSASMFDSEEDSSYGGPEDLSVGSSSQQGGEHGELTVKEEPVEEEVSDEREAIMAAMARRTASAAAAAAAAAAAGVSDEPGVWPCEKCGKLFSSHKDLERHQELLCHVKPFICHICHKAFRTNFRLWSHFQSHVVTSSASPSDEASAASGTGPIRSGPSPPDVAGAAGPRSGGPSPPVATATASSTAGVVARELSLERRASSSSPSSPPPLSISVSPPNPVGLAAASSSSAATTPATPVEEEEEQPPVVGPAANKTVGGGQGGGAGSDGEGVGLDDSSQQQSKVSDEAEGTEGAASLSPQESDTLFYHAPTLSALTFKRQYMCKLCHRTFKTAFSLWSHEQSHNRL